MYYPANAASFKATIQAPFVLAEIRALKKSIHKQSPQVQQALAVADGVAKKYNLNDPQLFIPAKDTYCAIIEPLSGLGHAGTLRRIGLEIFPQYISILGLQPEQVKGAMNVHSMPDLVRFICKAYGDCVKGPGAGALTAASKSTAVTVTDTTFMPCTLQMGVFLGAGALTELIRESTLSETTCRARHEADACTYEFRA